MANARRLSCGTGSQNGTTTISKKSGIAGKTRALPAVVSRADSANISKAARDNVPINVLLAAGLLLGAPGSAYAHESGGPAGGGAPSAPHMATSLQSHTFVHHQIKAASHLTAGSIGVSSFSTHHAHPVSNRAASHITRSVSSVSEGTSANLIQLSNGANLDLTSSATSITLGTNLTKSGGAVTIVEDGSKKSFSAGAQVTAAEYIAIKQVLSGAGQQLVLNGSGQAVGGSFNLNALAGSAPKLGELVISSGVTAIDNVGKLSSLTISGDLVNYGSLDVISSNRGHQSAEIKALDITNESGAVISSSLSLSGNKASSLDLSLSALDNLTNYGSMDSSGRLALSAGGTVSNASGATARATGNVSLALGNGNLSNLGVIQSTKGNINISTPSPMDINVVATGGTFNAALDINFRDASYAGSNNINLNGGNYLSQNVNLYSGSGDVEANVGQLTGNVNSVAGIEHVAASTSNLQLGNNTVSGDPIFANDAGNITITGNNTFSESVAILASGNILAGDSAAEITANGSSVIMIAGVNLTAITGGLATPNIPPTTSGITQVTMNGASATGGNIDFSANTTGTVIDTHATTSQGSGGDVTLAAFASGANTGWIKLGNVSGTHAIDTSGDPGTSNTAGGNGGNVTIIAGGTDATGTAVSASSIFTAGGSGSSESTPATSGNLSISTAQPVTNGPSGIATVVSPGTFQTDGSGISAGAITANANVSLNSIITAGGGGSGTASANASQIPGFAGASGGSITINAGGSITTEALESYGGGGSGGYYGNGGNGGAGGAINLTSATGGITINGDINASGGGGGAGYDPISGGGGVGGSGGNAGAININASTGMLSINGPILAASGGAGGGALGSDGGSGGGSFGGGGGAVNDNLGTFAAGGGGFLGGAGSNDSNLGGGGGGAFGGGVSGYLGGGDGSSGLGGSNPPALGGNFGAAGQVLNLRSGAIGSDVDGASPGNGNVTLTGSSIAISDTVASAFTGPGFANSAFANSSVVASTLTLNGSTITEAGSISGAITVNSATAAALINTSTSGATLDAITLSGGAPVITIRGENTTGTLQLGGVNAGSANVDLNNSVGGNIVSSGAVTTSNVLRVDLSTGSIGSLAQPINTNASIITIDGLSANAGKVFLTDSNAIITLDNATVGTFNLVASDNNAAVTVVAGPTGLLAQNISISAASATSSMLIQSTSNTLAAQPDTSNNGGSLSLTAGSIGGTGTGPLTFSADGTTGDGGTVSINITDSGSTSTLGNVLSSQFALSATGANGGSVSFTTSGKLSVFTDAIGVPVSLSYAPTGINGKGGNVSLSANSLVWGTDGSALDTPLVLTANGAGSGDGGSVSVNLTGTQAGAATIGAGNGDITLQATGSNGGTASFSTTGTVNIVTDGTGAPTAIAVGPGATGNGGSIYLTADTFQWGISGTGNATALALNVDGAGGGKAGFVAVTQTKATTALTVGTSAGDFSFSATGDNNTALPNGSGVYVFANGNLVASQDGINLGASNAKGSNVTLVSNSATTFDYGLNSSKNTNGVLDTISVAGSTTNGSLSFVNLGGLVTNSVAITSGVANLVMSGETGVTVGQQVTTDNSITLTVLGSGTISSSKTLTTDTLNMFTTDGNLGKSAISFSAKNVNVGAQTGSIALTNKNTTDPLTVGAFGGQSLLVGNVLIPAQTEIQAGGGTFTLTSPTSILTTADINAGGGLFSGSASVTIKATGNDAGIFLGGNIQVNTTKTTSGTVSLSSSTGDIGLSAAATSDVDISGVKSVTVTAKKGSIEGNASNHFLTIGQSVVPSSVVLSAANGITTDGILASSSVTEKATAGTVTLNSGFINAGMINSKDVLVGKVTVAAGGDITADPGTLINGGAAVSIKSSNAGIAADTVISGGPLSATAFNDAQFSNLVASGTSTKLTSKGDISVNDIDAYSTITLSALSSITTTGVVYAPASITAKTTGTGSTININNGGSNAGIDAYSFNSSGKAEGVVSLSVGTSGTISSQDGTDISGTKSTTLTATKGSIDVANVNTTPFNSVGTANLTALNSITSDGMIEGTSVKLSQTLKTTTAGTGIYIHSLDATNGAISAIAAGQTLTVDDTNSAASITSASTSVAATITLENSNTTVGNNGTISIGNSSGNGMGVTIKSNAAAGANGNVNIVIGKVPGTPAAGTAPVTIPAGNIIQNNGAVFFGTNGITAGANPSNIFLTANNANLIFATGTLPSTAITVHAGAASTTNITADPPSLPAPVHIGLPTGAATANSPDLSPTSGASTELQIGANSQINSLLQAGSLNQINSLGAQESATIAQWNGFALGNLVLLTTAQTASSASANFASFDTTQSSSVSKRPKDGLLFGAISRARFGDADDNSYMVSESGPTSQSDAAICSDEELGLQVAGVRSIAHGDKVKLDRGNVVFAPFQDTIVETPQGSVHIGANSVVLVSSSRDRLAVYDLVDSKKGSVKVEAKGQTVPLAPGTHMTIAPQRACEFAHVNAFEAIPHRNLVSHTTAGGTIVYTSEFSIPVAMATIKPLSAIVRAEQANTRKVASRMLKTAAILVALNGSRSGGVGSYQHYFTPRFTAMAR